MSVTVKEVQSKKDLRRFVLFPYRLFKGHPSWVPPPLADELQLFDRRKNPAFENADAKLFLAFREDRLAGRIAAILSHAANRKYDTRNLRFGWFDCIEDEEVAGALFGAVEGWARQLGMETITGPHGFCDFDPNGMMIEGFQHLATLSGNYNHPYYQRLAEKAGFQKEIDYVEFQTPVPAAGAPERLLHLAERVKERGKFQILKFKNKKELMRRAPELFELLDETFDEIYGAVPLTRKQMNYYIKKYFPFLDKDLIKAVVNEWDEMVGFMITMPSLCRALQKCGGRLLPFGWFHLLGALRRSDIIEFMLAGIRKDSRGLGVDLLMVIEIVQSAMKKGFRFAESNQELETNTKIQAQWKYFNPVQHKRRRIFKKRVAKT